jgi:hypothetical protein
MRPKLRLDQPRVVGNLAGDGVYARGPFCPCHVRQNLVFTKGAHQKPEGLAAPVRLSLWHQIIAAFRGAR